MKNNIFKKLDMLSEVEQCLFGMSILNFIIVFYMAVVPSLTQLRASGLDSMDFLETLNTAPMNPWLRIFLSLTCYFLISLTILLKKGCYRREGNSFVILSVYEIFLVVSEMILLDMSYNGILFFMVAEFMIYMDIKDRWFTFLVASFVVYIICNHYLISTIIPFNSFELWVSYYNETTSRYFLGLKEIFEIINIMLFLLFIVLLIFRNKREQREIRKLNARLAFANDQLELAVDELKDVNLQLKDANDQLHVYALEKEQMGETKERNRLAREIHDTLGHILTGISVGVDAVSLLMDINPDMAKNQLSTIGEMARNGLDDVRRSVRKLKPDSLETKNLDHAIYQLIEQMSKTTGSRIYFVSNVGGIHFGPDEEETIFRLVQEGTTNAIRHGQAAEIWIRIDRARDDVELSLKDNGKGCPDIQEGFGLTHMRERVEMLGGSITFSADNGFSILARIPIRQNG